MVNSGRAKSCTACRQVKLACNARMTAPEPCSRCHSSGFECRFDSNFKRIPMRKFSKEIATELHNLRVSQQPRASNSSRTSQSSPRSSSSAMDQAENEPKKFTSPANAIKPWLQLQVQEDIPVQQLGSVILHQDTIINLLTHFEQYYVPHAPFLQPVQSVTQLTNQSPLLFWTIILVATHRFNDDGIYDRLVEPLEDIFSRRVCTAMTSVETIHAFLIHCLWPIAKKTALLDPSFNYVNLATVSAMQINFHRPLHENNIARNWKAWVNYPNPGVDMSAGDITWLACFELSVRLGTFLGIPTIFSNTQQLKSLRKARCRIEANLPKESCAVYDILELLCMGTAQLDEIDNSTSAFSLIQSFAARLDVLQTKYSNHWTYELEVDLQAAKLYHYAIFFTKADPEHPGEQVDHATHDVTIHLQGLKAAHALVEAMTAISVRPILEKLFLAGTLSFFPKWYFTNLYFATVFLAKVLLTPGVAAGIVRSQALAHIMDSHKIFQSFPETRDHTRAAMHIEILVDIIRSNTIPNDLSLGSLVIRNRLGASVMFDANFRCGLYRNRNPVNGEPTPASDWKTVTESSQRLPKTPEEKVSALNEALLTLKPNQKHQEAEMWSEWDTYIGDFGTDTEQWNSLDSMQCELEYPPEDQAKHSQIMLQGMDPTMGFSVWR